MDNIGEFRQPPEHSDADLQTLFTDKIESLSAKEVKSLARAYLGRFGQRSEVDPTKLEAAQIPNENQIPQDHIRNAQNTGRGIDSRVWEFLLRLNYSQYLFERHPDSDEPTLSYSRLESQHNHSPSRLSQVSAEREDEGLTAVRVINPYLINSGVVFRVTEDLLPAWRDENKRLRKLEARHGTSSKVADLSAKPVATLLFKPAALKPK